MIANCDREHFLGFILLDHETIKMRFDVARKEIELKFLVVDLFRFPSISPSAGSGCVKVATETRSPKFCFMNSVIFAFSSSGEGNGGGFCSIGFKPTNRSSAESYHSTTLCKPARRKTRQPKFEPS